MFNGRALSPPPPSPSPPPPQKTNPSAALGRRRHPRRRRAAATALALAAAAAAGIRHPTLQLFTTHPTLPPSRPLAAVSALALPCQIAVAASALRTPCTEKLYYYGFTLYRFECTYSRKPTYLACRPSRYGFHRRMYPFSALIHLVARC